MERILHRLTMAAADAQMRHRMDVEDEYFSIIEKRDTEILIKDKRLAEQNVVIAEKDKQIQQKDCELQQKDSELQQKDVLLRKSVMALKSTMSVEQIAATLGIPADEVRRLSQD